MKDYELSVWPVVAAYDAGKRSPVEVDCLPEASEPLSGGKPVVVLDLQQHELLAMATSARQPIGFQADPDDPESVRSSALEALNARTAQNYGLNPGLAGHRCTPFGCIPGAADGSYVHLITQDGATVGDTAARAGTAHMVMRYAASISPKA